MFHNLKFNHDTEDFYEAIGIDQRTYDLAHYTTVYSMLAPLVTSALLEMEDGPSAKSELLESAINRIKTYNDDKLSVALLLVFERSYHKTMDRLKTYRDILKDKMENELKEGMRIQAEDLGEAIRNITRMIEARPLAQMIEVLKETSCNYDKFLQFTIDEVDMRVVLGHMTQEEVDAENDEDDDSEDAIRDRIAKVLSRKSKDKKDKPKDYDDIDDIIRRAFENGSEDED